MEEAMLGRVSVAPGKKPCGRMAIVLSRDRPPT
jgi:hypothetical protein